MKRKSYSLADKVRIVAEVKAAPMGTKEALLQRLGVRRSMVDRWARDEGITDTIKLARLPGGILEKSNPQVIPPATSELGDGIGFDESEHRLIKLACLNMRESLDAILYKLQTMDTPRERK